MDGITRCSPMHLAQNENTPAVYPELVEWTPQYSVVKLKSIER
jgi:hypothetical protein